MKKFWGILGGIVIIGILIYIVSLNRGADSKSANENNVAEEPIKDGSYYFDTKNCTDFSTHAEAQEFFNTHNPSADPSHLDRDHDGIACETLP